MTRINRKLKERGITATYDPDKFKLTGTNYNITINMYFSEYPERIRIEFNNDVDGACGEFGISANLNISEEALDELMQQFFNEVDGLLSSFDFMSYTAPNEQPIF